MTQKYEYKQKLENILKLGIKIQGENNFRKD